MTNTMLNGFLRDPSGDVVIVTATAATSPITEINGFLRDATGALVVSGVSGGGGTAATTTFDPTGLVNTSATDLQDAMSDYDGVITANTSAITANTSAIAAIPAIPSGIHVDMFQNMDGTWPTNPSDGLTRTWHGSGLWRGAWTASTVYATGDGVYVSGTGTFTAKTGFTSGGSFSSTNWNQVPMRTDDDLQLA